MANAKKSDLKVIPYTNRATLNRPARMTKMARPICEPCSEKGGPWWETCPHNPYFSVTLVPGPVEYVTEVNDEGEEIIVEEKPGPSKRVRTVNVYPVPNEVKFYSGKGVPWSVERGFKFPEELGYAPMCEYNNCWTPFPKYRTKYGNYCTEAQAKIISLRLRSKPIHQDPDKRAEQLADIPIEKLTG